MMGFDTALLVKGIEGGIFPSLRNAGTGYYYHNKGELQSLPLEPEKLGIEQSVRTTALPSDLCNERGVVVNLDAAIHHVAEQGIATLEGQKGTLYDAITYSASLILVHAGLIDRLDAAAEEVRSTLDSGKAKARFV
jgi:anthranilate phosphoribosyltransferase